MKLRPRLSVRTLAIVVTLVCAYLGAWEATKRYGVDESWNETSLAPFIIRRNRGGLINGRWTERTTYWLWLLGPKIKLPFESEWE
jgi:hypothetical protein